MAKIERRRLLPRVRVIVVVLSLGALELATFGIIMHMSVHRVPAAHPTPQADMKLTAASTEVSTISIWSDSARPVNAADPDGVAVELGLKFRSDVGGSVIGVRFYKAANNIGTHVGNLWTSTGARLASATFGGETASGWQQVNFASPVVIVPDTTYVVSYHTDVGHYSDDTGYFSGHGVDDGPLHALNDGVDGINGVYRYGAGGFPTQGWISSNYWVDVVLQPGAIPAPLSAPPPPPPAPLATPPAPLATPPAPLATPPPTPLAPPAPPAPPVPPAQSTQKGWPGPTNTGVPAGTALTQSGSITVTSPGTIIDAQDVLGTIEVKANNVTIKRSRVRDSADWLIRVNDGVSGVLIEDVEVDGGNAPGVVNVGIGWSGFTARRVNVHGTTDGIRMSENVVVEDSWIHDLSHDPASGGHQQCVSSFGGANITVRHNYMVWPHAATAVVFLMTAQGPIDGVLVDNNLLDGGGWTVYSINGGYGIPRNVIFNNNRFGRTYDFGVRDVEGPVIWRNNVWEDTGVAIPA